MRKATKNHTHSIKLLTTHVAGRLDAHSLLLKLIIAEGVLWLTGRRIRLKARFRRFVLTWQAARGELTPLVELDSLFTCGILKGIDCRDWVVVDCGANIGMFSLFLKGCKRIIAVEPNPECCQAIRENFALNGIVGVVIQRALNSNDGMVSMDFGAGPSVLAKVSVEGEGAQVRSTTLDALVEDQNLQSVDLLKLDLEGYEVEALKGASISLRNRVFVRILAEFNSPQALVELDAELEKFGYHRFKTDGYNALYVK
jgi:FkbM family methyltransferase